MAVTYKPPTVANCPPPLAVATGNTGPRGQCWADQEGGMPTGIQRSSGCTHLYPFLTSPHSDIPILFFPCDPTATLSWTEVHSPGSVPSSGHCWPSEPPCLCPTSLCDVTENAQVSCYQPNLKWTFSVRVGSSPRGTWKLVYNFNLRNKSSLENGEVAICMSPSHHRTQLGPFSFLFLDQQRLSVSRFSIEFEGFLRHFNFN